MNELTIDSDVFNKAYLPLFDSKKKFKVLKGGAGSGKSVFTSQYLVLKAIKSKRKILILRKVSRTSRQSTFVSILNAIDQFGLNDFAKINKSNLEIKLLNSEFLFLGLDDVKKLKSIAGITDVWMEEADEDDQEDLQQLVLRVRGKSLIFPEFYLTFNPISTFHWLKKVFFDEKLYKSVEILETTYLDNDFLDDDYKQELENLKDIDENYYNIYCLGRWGSLSKGLIYKHFQYKDYVRGNNYYYGLDFGYSHYLSLTEISQYENDYSIDEKIYETHLTSELLIQRMQSLKISKTKEIYADGSRPEMIEDLVRAGYNVRSAYKNAGSVFAGIRFIKGKNIFTNKNNIGLNKETTLYKWKEHKNGQILDEVVKLFDDSMDSIRYGIYTRYIETSNIPKAIPIRKNEVKNNRYK